MDIISIDQRDEELTKQTEATTKQFIEYYKTSDEFNIQSKLIEENSKQSLEGKYYLSEKFKKILGKLF